MLLKQHVREPFELPPDVQREHFREVMRAAEAISLMVRHPHAVALVDAGARPHEEDPAEPRVDALKLIVAIQVGEQEDVFPRLVQKVVNEQTDAPPPGS